MISTRWFSRAIFFSLSLALLGAGCGGGSTAPPPPAGVPAPGGGTVVVVGQDAPADNIVKFEVDLMSVVLNPGNVSVLPQPERIELTSMQLEPELIRLAQGIPAGSYTSITLTLANPEVKFCPDTIPPTVCTDANIQEVEPPLTNSSVTVNISFSVVAGQVTGLVVDFDLAASLVTDPITEAITGVDPAAVGAVTVTLLDITGVQDELEDITGRVVSLNRTSSTSGTFVFEAFSSCDQITVTVDADTEFEDFDEANPPLANTFDGVQANQIVEVDIDIEGDGGMVAEKVELEDELDDDDFEGLIIETTRDGADRVTEFVMVLLEEPPCIASVPATDLITVTVPTDGSVIWRIDDDDFIVAATRFDEPAELEIGQKVDVDPVEDVTTATTAITAEKIKLEDQTIRGTVVTGSIVTPNFELDPNAALFPDQSIEVETVTGQTRFDDLPNGVASLTNNQAVRVKGLLFRLSAGVQQFFAKRVDGTP
ncbi:MAG: DUF4382 domain-containing protein [Acidobacteriota bacterium]